MRKAILLAAVLVATLAAFASADMLSSVIWNQRWSEDFEAYWAADPNPLTNRVLGRTDNSSYDPWEQWQLPQYKGYQEPEEPTNMRVRATACSATYQVRAAWAPCEGVGDNEIYQLVTFQLKAQDNVPSVYSLNVICSNNDTLYEGSNAVPMWDISNLAVRPHVRRSWDFYDDAGPEWIGPDVAIAAGTWHTLAFAWNIATGEAEWYVDNVLVASLPDDPVLKGYYLGRDGDNFEFWQKYVVADAANNVLFDNLASYSGVPIPEPGTLGSLGTLCIGALAVLRRRIR
ncbi:MAG: PEP-CTERM sorting domain-containing protein [Armatimonadota bacterium]|nr:PEP-CTERM sorting domain-containing protein [Armatimonadota bacterium]